MSTSDDFTVNSTGIVREVTDTEELEKLILIKYTNKGRTGKAPTDFQGTSKNRLYVYEITKAWVADKEHKKCEVDLDLC